MPRAHRQRSTTHTRRITWSRAVLAVVVTLWVGKWIAVTLEPSHSALYLAVVVAFLLSTARPVRRTAG